MKKIFLFSTLAFLFIFFSCQKNENLHPEISHEKGISFRNTLTPEALAGNENFKLFVHNYLLNLGKIETNFNSLDFSNQEELSLIFEKQEEEITEAEFMKLLELYSITSEDEAIKIWNENLEIFESIKNDFPDLNTINRETFSKLFHEAFSLRLKDDIFLGDEINFPEGSTVWQLKCTQPNSFVYNTDGTKKLCRDYVKCIKEWGVNSTAAWDKFSLSVFDCFVEGGVTIVTVTAAGAGIGAVITSPTGPGSLGGGAIGASIGGTLAFFVSGVRGLLCLRAAKSAHEKDCLDALNKFNDCCY